MIQITDVLGAFVEAQLQAQEWEQEFQAQFFGALARALEQQAAMSSRDAMSGDMGAQTMGPMGTTQHMGAGG